MAMTHRDPVVAERHFDAMMRWHIVGTASGGLLSLGEVELKAGDEPPMHVHAREDEAWFVIDGEMLFQRGVERHCLGAGEAILLPRGIAHGFAVRSERARALHFYTPAGLESAFQALSTPLTEEPKQFAPELVAEVFEGMGVSFVGPPLPAMLAGESGRNAATS